MIRTGTKSPRVYLTEQSSSSSIQFDAALVSSSAARCSPPSPRALVPGRAPSSRARLGAPPPQPPPRPRVEPRSAAIVLPTPLSSPATAASLFDLWRRASFFSGTAAQASSPASLRASSLGRRCELFDLGRHRTVQYNCWSTLVMIFLEIVLSALLYIY